MTASVNTRVVARDVEARLQEQPNPQFNDSSFVYDRHSLPALTGQLERGSTGKEMMVWR